MFDPRLIVPFRGKPVPELPTVVVTGSSIDYLAARAKEAIQL
jgi:hypothetical protein